MVGGLRQRKLNPDPEIVSQDVLYEDHEKEQRFFLLEQVFGSTIAHVNQCMNNNWTWLTFFCFIFICVLSLVTRFYNVEQPAVVLFDEVHFVSMAQWYKARKYFFDIHPPLGKLCLAAIAYFTDFHTDEPYRDIGKAYLHSGYIYMRYWQAFWGSTLAPICFLISKNLTGNTMMACGVALLIIFELSLQTISRAILLDSFLHSTMFASLYFALKLWQENDLIIWQQLRIIEKNDWRYFRFWCWTILCSFMLGFSFSIKHTALGMIGVIGLIQIIKWLQPLLNYLWLQRTCSDRESKILNYEFPNDYHMSIIQWTKRMLFAGLFIVAIVIVLYFFFFYVHFTVIKYTGVDEDSMSDNYRSQLIGSTIPMPQGESPQGMWKNIIDINLKMIEVNAAVYYEGFYISPWYEWPFMYKGVMYHWEQLSDGKHSCVYLFGNPLIFWIVLVGVIVGTLYWDRVTYNYLVRSKRSSPAIGWNLSLCLLGYYANILPYPLLIKRPCYMYHYHPSLIFGILLLGILVDSILLFRKSFARMLYIFVAFLILVLVIVAYIHFLPFSYNFPLSDIEHEQRRWFKAVFAGW